MASNIVLSEVEYRVVGKRPLRPDGVDKVTGRAQYGADVNLTCLPMAPGKILDAFMGQGRWSGRGKKLVWHPRFYERSAASRRQSTDRWPLIYL